MAACKNFFPYSFKHVRDVMQRFQDQIVVVTGASSGIGRELARAFSGEGATVVLAARSVDALEQLAAELRVAGGQALVVPTDVRDYGQIERLMHVTQETFGRLDVLVNNAGQGLGVWAKDLTMGPVEDLFRTNLFGLIYATRLALPGMIARRRGLIINVSSVAGKVGTPSDSIYAASKFAVNGFSQGLRAEVAQHNVRVLTVCPFFTSGTGFSRNVVGRGFEPRNPLRRMSARRVAELTLDAAARGKHELVLTRTARFAVFLNHTLPGVFDWGLATAARFLK